MESSHKHSYLQSPLQKISPRVINRSVNLAREQPTIDEGDQEPPLLRLTSEQPNIPAPNIDPTKLPEAFGRWAIPKLRRSLHNPDSDVVLQAVCSLSDLLHDPEKGYEAIRLRVPDRLADLLDHESEAIRERVCMVLIVISGLSDGKGAIVRNKLTLQNIEKLMFDTFDTIRHKNALLLESVSRSWFAADYLVDAGFVKKILEVLPREEEPIQIAYLEALTTLMYGEGKDEALSLGAFDIFVDLMETKPEEVAARAADCLMMITSTYTGKDIAYDTAVLPKLARLLHHDNVNLYTGAASAIMFCTIKSRAKFRAKEIPHLVDRLVALTNDWHHRGAQIYSIRALAHICEHPDVRKEVKEKYLEKLEQIIIGSDEGLARHKTILLGIVRWHPWEMEG